MKKIIYLVYFFTFTVSYSLFAQNIDYSEALQKTREKESKFYYKKLLDRFNKNDSLTANESIMLALGYTNQDEYNPQKQSELELQLSEFNKNENYKKAAKEGLRYLKDNPISLIGLSEVAGAYKMLGDVENSKVYWKRFDTVLKGVTESGTGIDFKSAFMLINPKDTNILLILWGMKLSDSKIERNEQYTYKIVNAIHEGKAIQIYFNITPAMGALLRQLMKSGGKN